MTINDLINKLTAYNLYLAIFFLALPLLTFVFTKTHSPIKASQSPYKYIYSFLVYAVSGPGIFALVITVYSLFIISANLLAVNFLIYFLPIISLIVTLVIIRKQVSFDDIPGFDRLYSLFILLAVTFGLTLIIMKTRIWLLFGASFQVFVALIVFLFLLLKWSSYMLFRGKHEKKLEPPKFPGI